MNNQPIEKRHLNEAGNIFVKSIFFTIQGEGPFSGRPAIFIRLAGCNLQCPLCDTEYTGSDVRQYTPREAFLAMESCWDLRGPRPLVVITGGEPFRQNITPLVSLLLQKDYSVQVETNGTLPPPPGFAAMAKTRDVTNHFPAAYVVVSPKAGKVAPLTAQLALAYKYVISHDSVDPNDGLPVRVLGHPVAKRVARPPRWRDLPVYIQPCDHKNEEMNKLSMAAAVRVCQLYGYTLQIQIHKVLGVE